MKNESLSRKMNRCLRKISRHDVILTNGQKHIVCLFYNQECYDAPILIFKASNKFQDYFFKIAQTMRIPCLENKLLATALFDEVDEGDYISEKFFIPVSKIYTEILGNRKRDHPNDFDVKLPRVIMSQFYGVTRDVCKSAERKVCKTPPAAETKRLADKDVLEYVEDRMSVFAEKYGLDLRISDNPFGERHFCIDSLIFWDIQKSNLGSCFWQMLTVSLLDRKIYVGNVGRFRAFDIEDAVFALNYYTAVFEYCGEKLVDNIKKYSSELWINFKSYSLAQDMVKTMLELNRKNNGIEYSFDSDTTVMDIYLEKHNAQKGERYEVVLTYNAFLRAPAAFKDFIANPRRKTTWNFWCRKTIRGR